MKKVVGKFVKKEIVLCISFLLAVISVFIVPPSKEYASYIDFRTLAILLGMMIVMSGLQRLNVFGQLGEILITRVKNIRAVSLLLIMLCFFLSMLITNDVALLTFVPFTVIVFNLSKQNKYLLIVIILETVAANLGSMMLPMGNPQNIYLFSLSGISFAEFIMLMLPYGLVSLLLIWGMACFFVKKETFISDIRHEYKRNSIEKVRLYTYFASFILSILVVIRVVDYRIGFLIILLAVICLDRKVLFFVDYSLIFTFVFLFVFIGNLKHVEVINEFLMGITKENEIMCAVLSSQVISNVPAAILLSGFTENIKALIVGTNLGGLGTLIASMASLISFKLYSVTIEADKKKYIVTFSAINIIMLAILVLEAAYI